MEASALTHAPRAPGLAGLSPYLRLQSDERLVAMVRRGHDGAFEALLKRYESRLLAFCRHMLASKEDAEDVLQEVFASAHRAIRADERSLNVRPWLYRIARNRCLNHLRRPVHAGQDSMDVFERAGGATTADTVHSREEFRQVVSDVQDLPESQRSALLLREIDALSYEQISEVMDTTVPSVKSLLVRARVSLAEAAEARLLTCDEVRLELGVVAEGLARTTAPVRRHVKGCERCRVFKRELRSSTRALAAIYPIGPALILKNLLGFKLGAGTAGTGAAAGSSVAGGTTLAGGVAAAGGTASSIASAGLGAIASKAAAGIVAAAIVTAGVSEVRHARSPVRDGGGAQAQVEALATAPVAPATGFAGHPATGAAADKAAVPEPSPAVAPETKARKDEPSEAPATDTLPAVAPVPGADAEPALPTTPEAPAADEPVAVVPGDGVTGEPGAGGKETGDSTGVVEPATPPPGEAEGTPPASHQAPVAGESPPPGETQPKGDGQRSPPSRRPRDAR